MTEDLHPVNEEQWEAELEEFMTDEPEMEWTMVEFDVIDEGQPPQVDPETVKEIEAAAGQEEISRLLDMGVMRNPTPQEVEQGEPGQSMIGVFEMVNGRGHAGLWRVSSKSKDICANVSLDGYRIDTAEPM